VRRHLRRCSDLQGGAMRRLRGLRRDARIIAARRDAACAALRGMWRLGRWKAFERGAGRVAAAQRAGCNSVAEAGRQWNRAGRKRGIRLLGRAATCGDWLRPLGRERRAVVEEDDAAAGQLSRFRRLPLSSMRENRMARRCLEGAQREN